MYANPHLNMAILLRQGKMEMMLTLENTDDSNDFIFNSPLDFDQPNIEGLEICASSHGTLETDFCVIEHEEEE